MTDNKEFWTAFVAAQREMRDPVKDAKNPHFKSRFVSLKGVFDAVRGPLHNHGIAVSQTLDHDGDRIVVVTALVHGPSGQGTASRCPVVCAKQNDPQALGSAITYARRYALAAICGIAPADDDDDGEGNYDRKPAAHHAPKPVVAQAVEAMAKAGLVQPYDMDSAMEALSIVSGKEGLDQWIARVKQSPFSEAEMATLRNAWKVRAKEIANG